MFKKNIRPRQVKKKVEKRKPAEYWSEYQNNIFEHVGKGENHSVVLAAPGSGKTTTIIESLYHIPQNQSSLYLAFNSSVEEEFMLRCPLGTKAKTFHKLGMDTVRREWGAAYELRGRECIDKDDQALELLVAKLIGNNKEGERLRESIVWATKMSKTMLAQTVEEIERVCCEFGISSCGLQNAEFSGIVEKILNLSKQEPLMLNGKRVVSFDDMIWLPYVRGWQPEKFDRIFVDEAQDLSAARINLALGAMFGHTKICSSGDLYQCIYQFAGANSDIINKLINDMEADTLPLSVSYRCPKKIVELAKDINPDIEASEFALDGDIHSCDIKDIANRVKPGSVILSRNNYMVINTAFALIKKGIKISIIGKDVGARFIWRIKNWKPASIADFKKSINNWRTEMIEIFGGRSAARVNDEADSIMMFANASNTVDEAIKKIYDFFREDENSVILSTAHKAKGLEWDDVFILSKTFKPESSQEESNIFYVAITRTKKSLTFVN